MSEGGQRIFLFPIAALQAECAVRDFGGNEFHDIKEGIVDYCMTKVGLDFMHSKDESVVHATANRRIPIDVDIDAASLESDQCAVLCGSSILGVHFCVSLNSLQWSARAYDRINLRKLGRCHVAFPRDLFWEAVEKWSYRDFAVLCGVWAAIGNDAFKKVQVERVAAMACGYSSHKELPKHKAGLALTRDETRWTLRKLEKAGWFRRVPANRRHTYFTKTLTEEQLIEQLAVKEHKRRKENSLRNKQSRVEEFMRRLEAADAAAGLKSMPPQHPHNAPT